MEGWADRGACRVRVAGPLPSAPQSASWGCTQKREVVPMGGSDRVKGPQHWPGAKQEGGSRGLLHDVGAVRRGRGTGQRGRVTGPGPGCQVEGRAWASHGVKPLLARKAVATTQRRASRSEFRFISGVYSETVNKTMLSPQCGVWTCQLTSLCADLAPGDCLNL